MKAIENLALRMLAALPFGRRLCTIKDRLASFADQGLQGVANVLVNVLLARSFGRDVFASFGLMLGVHYLVLGVHRANVVLPFILDGGSHEVEDRRAPDAWWRFNLIFVVATALVLVLGAAAAGVLAAHRPDAAWVARALAYAVVVSPALLLAEFGRRWLYQAHLPATAAVASGVYFSLNIGVAAAVFGGVRIVWLGAAAWAAAGLAAFLVAGTFLRPGSASWREATAVWKRHRPFALWQTLTTLPFAVYNSSVVVLVGAFGGAAATAAFTVTRTLTNPAISMVSAVDSLDKPRAARALATGGLAGLRASIAKTRRFLAIITGAYLTLLVVFATPLLHLAFGRAYGGQTLEVRILSVAFFLICMNQPSETLLIVLRAGRLMFITRVIAAVSAVMGLWWAGRTFGVLGCVSALLGVQLVNLLTLRLAEVLAQDGQVGAPARSTP